MIKQQIEIMKNSQLKPTSEFCSTEKIISDILVPPKQTQRSGIHRNYKIKSYGGMNSKEMIDKFEELEAEKLKAEGEKAEKRKQREEKRQINETIKNIKKEKHQEALASRKRVTEEEVIVKKRGRPAKMKQ